ncbi:MAG TPA: SMC family ATPase [Candidatus Limnocylindrales bacterium]|nr:SMC family ATPase [Candidatus Limnocylindrales bacterium]
MLPVRLELKNFLAYRESVVQFDGIHLACLTGPNGAGKSSLLDAITWSLWGKARGSARADELMHLGQAEMWVQLDFLHEGVLYRVLRKRARKGAGISHLDLFAWTADGAWNSISEPTLRATEAKINRLLRLDYETFTHSAFLQQGKADSFTNLTPADRKEVLAEILGLKRFESYEKAAREQFRAADHQLGILKAQLEDIETQLSREPELITALRLAEEQHETASLALAEADTLLREVEYVPMALKDAVNNAAVIEQRLTNARRSLTDAQRKLTEAEIEVAAQEKALAGREQVEAGYQELQQARSENQALAEKFEQFTQVREKIGELEKEASRRRSVIEGQISKLEGEISAAEKTIREADPEAYARAREDVERLAEAEAALTATRDEIGLLEQERSALQAEKKHLEDETAKRRERYKNLRNVEGAECPLCGQPLDATHRAELLADIEADGKQLNTQVSDNRARVADIHDRLEALNAARKGYEATVKALEGSKAIAVRFEDRQKRAHAAEAERDEAAAKRDALSRDLEAGGYAASLTTEIASLQAERDALGYDDRHHKDAKRRLTEHEAYDLAHQRLMQAQAALPGALRALESARNTLTLTQGTVEDEQTALDAARARTGELTALLAEFQKRKQTADDLRRKDTSANEARVLARQELKALDDQRTRRDELTRQQTEQREQRGIYEELTSAFGRNGLPAMLIETAIPEIEEDANELLRKMSGGRMTVRINTQREKVTGGTIETLDFLVSDELGERSYDTFSGGEAFRVNFALRVAMSELLARRAGAHLNALFLDEGFGTQDEEGRARLVEAITAVQDRFQLILVITHIEELRDSFPVHLEVTKTAEGSKVTIR